ncbi:MAG: hypothetical protein IPL95_02050 [Saprospiraceae bacterium]|nr:hypothetical protein [Saprospiraceae bacterium]
MIQYKLFSTVLLLLSISILSFGQNSFEKDMYEAALKEYKNKNFSKALANLEVFHQNNNPNSKSNILAGKTHLILKIMSLLSNF